MNETQSINTRIKLVIDFYHLNQAGFANKIDVSSVAVGNIIGGRKSKPSFDFISKLINHCPEINIIWLMTGEGAMEMRNIKGSILDYSMDDVMLYLEKNEDQALNHVAFRYFLRAILERLKLNETKDTYLELQKAIKNLEQND